MDVSFPKGIFPVSLGSAAVFFFLVTLCLPAARAQSTSEFASGLETASSGHETQVWTSGGYSAYGGELHVGVWNAGLRYGWMLTGPHGPGPLRGSLEYAVDVVPVFVVFQQSGPIYGAGLNPFAFKWNFETHGRHAPYFEIGGGTLFTHEQVPVGTSRVNFTSGGALGINIPSRKGYWFAELRLMHISNASLADRNPGINTLQVRIGLGRFGRRRTLEIPE
jgi:Lipid A 3-O-deacylase (PagL)